MQNVISINKIEIYFQIFLSVHQFKVFPAANYIGIFHFEFEFKFVNTNFETNYHAF